MLYYVPWPKNGAMWLDMKAFTMYLAWAEFGAPPARTALAPVALSS